MSDESYQCTCLASFPTDEALKYHLDDYKIQIDFHSARVEECGTHARANDGADSDDASDCDDPDKTIKYCPHETCSPSKTYPKGQGLRRHFATHVKCNEICVFCHKLHKIASELLRHVQYYHLDEHGTKAIYMRQISQELSQEVVRRLYQAKRVCTKKRGLEEAELAAEMSQARRVRLEESVSAAGHNVDQRASEVDITANGVALNPTANFEGLVALEPRNAAALAETAEVSAVAPDNFEGVTQEFYPDTRNELTQGGSYDPAITRITNWPAGWDEVETMNQILGGMS